MFVSSQNSLLAFFLKSKGLFRLLISKVKRILIRFVLRMKIH